MHTPKHTTLKQKLLANDSVHYWVKDLIELLDSKDVVDVLNNLNHLVYLYDLKLQESKDVANLYK